jgi:hypothetical protein
MISGKGRHGSAEPKPQRVSGCSAVAAMVEAASSITVATFFGCESNELSIARELAKRVKRSKACKISPNEGVSLRL